MMLLTLALSFSSRSGIAPGLYASDAARITARTIQAFYDPRARIWKPPVASAESVGDQGYTFWPSLLAWQAVIEAAKVDPKTWRSGVATYFDVLEQYFDRAGHAYCAWRYFPGNDDQFYDDNTWAAVACLEAYAVTGEARYRARAVEVFDGFVKGGWDARGGLRWGTKAGIADRTDRTVSATAAVALAALLVHRVRHDPSDLAWAKRALGWIRNSVSAPSGLVQDGLKADGTLMPTLWTYNTGVPIRAAAEYFRQTKDVAYRAWAVRMGDACLDRSLSPLYDGAVGDLSKRYWYDGVYFAHYLVDGLRELSRLTGDGRYVAEARREADYAKAHLLDKDGLYWRNLRLWTIDADRTAAFRKLTGADVGLAPDASERSLSPETLKKPVGERPTVKTLLANAGAARMFWLLAH